MLPDFKPLPLPTEAVDLAGQMREHHFLGRNAEAHRIEVAVVRVDPVADRTSDRDILRPIAHETGRLREATQVVVEEWSRYTRDTLCFRCTKNRGSSWQR